MKIPNLIPNWLNGSDELAGAAEVLPKVNPATGKLLHHVTRSRDGDVDLAVSSARRSQPAWAAHTPVYRGDMLREMALAIRARQREVAEVVALETGKSPKEALSETLGAVELGLFMAGEGRRLYGRTTTSAIPNRHTMTIRQPLGVAGLIIAANTPIANVAWKVFPALLCGNSAVLKASEDAPATAWLFGRIAHEAGLSAGVLNIVQGYGQEAGASLVAHADVAVISFTGSTAVGREIAVVAGRRLAKISLELGGKNPLVVCDDADLEMAAAWAVSSAFSNAGQRCASASRLIVFDSIYDEFRHLLVDRAKALKVGPNDDDDFGPVINERQLRRMLDLVERARQKGAAVLAGGCRLTDATHRDGYYMAATLLENVGLDDEISNEELFGPIACLYRVSDFSDAVTLANKSPYGLTACIHTRSIHRGIQFTEKVQAGVTVVNGGTYGSEPHMPFGGVKQSGNGTREPGTEALDVYSNVKSVYINVDPNQL